MPSAVKMSLASSPNCRARRACWAARSWVPSATPHRASTAAVASSSSGAPPPSTRTRPGRVVYWSSSAAYPIAYQGDAWLMLDEYLYDPTAGRILLNGSDLRNYRIEVLRSIMALVPQEPFLFAGTVRDNITLGRRTSAARLATVLDQAALTETMAAFPQGLETLVGEKGIVLSGGGALIRSLDQRLREETGLPVVQADDPLCSVVLGTGRMLEDMDLLRKVSLR